MRQNSYVVYYRVVFEDVSPAVSDADMQVAFAVVIVQEVTCAEGGTYDYFALSPRSSPTADKNGWVVTTTVQAGERIRHSEWG